MKDQVRNLRKRGIKALSIYSGMSRQDIITTLENCIFGNYKFLYISPNGWIRRSSAPNSGR